MYEVNKRKARIDSYVYYQSGYQSKNKLTKILRY